MHHGWFVIFSRFFQGEVGQSGLPGREGGEVSLTWKCFIVTDYTMSLFTLSGQASPKKSVYVT